MPGQKSGTRRRPRLDSDSILQNFQFKSNNNPRRLSVRRYQQAETREWQRVLLIRFLYSPSFKIWNLRKNSPITKQALRYYRRACLADSSNCKNYWLFQQQHAFRAFPAGALTLRIQMIKIDAVRHSLAAFIGCIPLKPVQAGLLPP